MARKKSKEKIDVNLRELQKYLREKPNSLLFGTKRNIKLIKLGKVKEIFLARDCYDKIKERILNYSRFSDIKVNVLLQTKEELALICKKDFQISVIGVLNK